MDPVRSESSGHYKHGHWHHHESYTGPRQQQYRKRWVERKQDHGEDTPSQARDGTSHDPYAVWSPAKPDVCSAEWRHWLHQRKLITAQAALQGRWLAQC